MPGGVGGARSTNNTKPQDTMKTTHTAGNQMVTTKSFTTYVQLTRETLPKDAKHGVAVLEVLRSAERMLGEYQRMPHRENVAEMLRTAICLHFPTVQASPLTVYVGGRHVALLWDTGLNAYGTVRCAIVTGAGHLDWN